jgi:hypothetical protein
MWEYVWRGGYPDLFTMSGPKTMNYLERNYKCAGSINGQSGVTWMNPYRMLCGHVSLERKENDVIKNWSLFIEDQQKNRKEKIISFYVGNNNSDTIE